MINSYTNIGFTSSGHELRCSYDTIIEFNRVALLIPFFFTLHQRGVKYNGYLRLLLMTLSPFLRNEGKKGNVYRLTRNRTI